MKSRARVCIACVLLLFPLVSLAARVVADGQPASARLPAVGETISFTVAGEALQMQVLPLDTAALEAIGVPAYPGAIGAQPIGDGELYEEAIGLLTSDPREDVVAFYEERLGDTFVDQSEAFLRAGEADAELGRVNGDSSYEADLAFYKSVALLVDPQGTAVAIFPLDDLGYTVIVAQAWMGVEPPLDPEAGWPGDQAAEDETERASLVLPPRREAPLPQVGEIVSIEMIGEAAEVRIVPVDTAGLGALGIPAYPGAVGGEPTEPIPDAEFLAAMLTTDALEDVTAYYRGQLGERFSDVSELMTALLEAGAGDEEPSAQLAFMRSATMLIDMVNVGVFLIIFPVPDVEWTVILAGRPEEPSPDAGNDAQGE